MKKLLIILLIGFSGFSQTFEVVNKGYYYGIVGDTVLPNHTTDLKALTDVQEYLEKHNLENGEVVRPKLEVIRKKTVPMPPHIIRDTIYINSEISIGNQWMGEPIVIKPIYGTVISDNGNFNPANSPHKAFDKDPLTMSVRHNQSLGWIGQDYGTPVSIKRFRFLPSSKKEDALKMNNALIQYSSNGTNWITIHTITGINETNFSNWIDVSFTPVIARYFRIYATQNGSYCRVRELEFYK